MLGWDSVALNPSLHRCMISMAQLSSHRANTAAKADQIGVINHGALVRNLRTFVNVENELDSVDFMEMDDESTIGAQLRLLQQRSGLSYDAIASRAGYTGRSSVQRYFDPDYAPEYLPLNIAKKLAKGFEGSGIDTAAILALSGVPTTNANVIKFEGSNTERLTRDIPIFGTSLGAPLDFDGGAIEQTMLNTGNIIGYLPRPSVLNGVRAAYGLYVQGSSMSPRFEDGETIFATDSTQSRPPKIGDDVILYFRDMEKDDGASASAVMVKRLARKTGSFYELQQFNPPITFRVEVDRVLRVDRVIPWSELLS